MPFYWRWKSFTPAEVLSADGLEQFVNHHNLLLQPFALDALQSFRNKIGLPIIVTSGYRSERENNSCKGKKFSRHVQGIAFDIRVKEMTLQELFEAAKAFPQFGAVGIYHSKNFIHVDCRPRVLEVPITWSE